MTVKEEEGLEILTQAVDKVEEKISWHRAEIDRAKSAITENENAIQSLRNAIQLKFSNLVTPSQPVRLITKQQRNVKRRTAVKKRSPNGSTSALILDFLRGRKVAADTATIKQYLESHGNQANPSVELGRMISKGLISRPGRGLYQAN